MMTGARAGEWLDLAISSALRGIGPSEGTVTVS